jgi:hypothetical protein
LAVACSAGTFEHLDAGIEQRDRQRDGVVDPGIAVDDQLAGHDR